MTQYNETRDRASLGIWATFALPVLAALVFTAAWLAWPDIRMATRGALFLSGWLAVVALTASRTLDQKI